MGHRPKNPSCVPVSELLERVLIARATTRLFSRDPRRIAILPKHIATIIGDAEVYLSEFIIAKVMGLVVGLAGHPEITRAILEKLPENLEHPIKIFKDIRSQKKYLFIHADPLHQVVVEIARKESGKTEINTIHLTNPDKLKKLEHKFPTVFSSGETPGPRMRASR